jgi:DNA-binding CsgD family transcriptional regulator
MAADSSLVDQLYEAALIPELWPDALGEMGALSGSALASLWLFGDNIVPSGIAPGVPPDIKAQFLGGLWRESPAVQWILDRKPASFTDVNGALPPEAVARDPTWAPMDSLGFGDSLGIAFPAPSGEVNIFMLARMKDRGRYSKSEVASLDAFRPHLARATLVASRLSLKRARAMVETLEWLGLAAAVISHAGRVIASNALLEHLPSVLLPTAFGGIAIADHVKNEQFRSALSRIGGGEQGPALSIPVPAGDDHSPLIIHLLPVRGQALDIFTGGHALMVVSTISRKVVPEPELLYGLFDLSPAEARLVGALLTGATLAEIAARTGRAVPTLRNQMRSVLAKTGVRRQAELTQLLAALPRAR